MARLPAISGAEAVRAFKRAGWREDRQRGSHVILIKMGHHSTLSILQHRELAPGTLRLSFVHPVLVWKNLSLSYN
jgi:predicted RNA binding protein YcfA (HicA-like mRNA interferase family)